MRRPRRKAQLPVPDPDQFKGRPLRAFLYAIRDYLQAIVDQAGLGRPLVVLAYTGAGGISARAGTTAGSGTVNAVVWDGTDLSNSGNGTFTAYNAYGAAFAGNAYVWCKLWRGVYWATTQECT